MSDQQWPPRRPGETRPPYQGQQPYPGSRQPQQPQPGRPPRPHAGQQWPRPGQHQPYAGDRRYPGQQQPYSPTQQPYPEHSHQHQPQAGSNYPEQHYPGQNYPEPKYPGANYPDQNYGDQNYGDPNYGDPNYGDPYYPDQNYPGQHYPDQHHSGQPPAYPQDLGPGRFGPEPPKKRRWPKVLVGLLVLALVGVGGYGAYDFYQQTQEWKQTTTDDMVGVGSDLSVAVASLRSVGWEVTADDIGTWLEQPGAYGDGLTLRTLQVDEATNSFSVAGYRTWQDTYAKRDHTTVVCANITLATGTQKPLGENITTCPDDVPKTAPDRGATTDTADPATAGGVTGHLAELTVEASEQRADGATEGKLLEVAAPTKPVGDVRADSTALECAPGTKDLGEGEGYDAGKLIPVRLCAVEGLPNTGTESTKGDNYYIDGSDGLTVVNARISGAAAALVRKASKQGIDLVAGSSFRTMEKQKALCREDLSGGCQAGDYTLTAQPGYSSHQLGIAIDFEEPSVTGGKTCATRASEPSSKVWTFLNKTALEFGLKQYAPEAWHWDAYGGKDRCAPM
ncbi:D-alanyl-D-alanine carboxypeptidase family protein [Nocardioides sp. CCNWLW239]|uniref:D-alanyl-D-alanine carboxypeptidase family protein n=1 Tax=Nocardioides sp. CCNWLW239 TaxID=3128902 RepID=UPI003017FF68